MENAEATIQDIVPAYKLHTPPTNEIGAETMAYKMTITSYGYWWVYRHQFEIIVDDDE